MLLGLDFDGTLADSQTAVESSLFWVASNDSKDSVALLKKNLEIIVGKTLEQQLKSFIKNLNVSDARQLFMNYYQTEGVHKTVLNIGARTLLTYCRKNDIQLVVISAKTDENLQLSMRHLAIDYIPSFGGCDQNKKSQLLRTFKTDLYVGDQGSDILAAKNAGVKSVLLGESQSLNVSPDFEIHNLSQVVEIIRKF